MCLFPILRHTLSRHFLEEAAECSQVLKAQNGADFLSALPCVQQQASGFRTYPFVNDAKRRRQSAGRKQVGKRLRRTAKHIGIVLHLFLFTEILVYQHIEPTDNIESPLILLPHTKPCTCYARTGDDETFQYNPQHLFLKIVINGGLLTEDADYIMQVGRLLLGQLQPHHPGRTVEQKAVAGHLIVMSVDAVEVTVENKGQELTCHLFDSQMMQRGKRDNLVFRQLHGYMVYLDGERAALYPEKLIQSLVALQRLVFVKAGCHCDIAVQTRIQLVVHRLPLFVRVTKIANILLTIDYFPIFAHKKNRMSPIQFVSLGPGEAELITLKGLKALQNADCIFCPETPVRDGHSLSRAADIMLRLDIPANRIRRFSLPMSKQRTDALNAYDQVYAAALSLHHAGKKVAIVAEGDAGFYSSVHYIYEKLQAAGIPVEQIAGIPAFIAAGARGGLHIASQEERLTVIPGITTVEEIERLIQSQNTVVIMKLSQCTDEVHRCIRLHPEYDYRYFENVGTPQEKYISDGQQLETLRFPYFSLLIIRHNGF